ncbi:hypothetical protein [Yoonia sp. 208BN28-4]|uniref:hypothetical protein n=1 Tax=Yoonia sp. 208BN28-4 TaxID=3126505 RepID=UPI0030B6EE2E
MQYHFLIPLFLLLAACGGSSGSAVDSTAEPPPDTNQRPVPDIDLVDPTDLPVSGRFDYAGEISLDFAPAGGALQTATSPLALDVDFGGGDAQVTGHADGFSGYNGRIFFSLGEIDRTAGDTRPAITGTLSGTLKEASENYLVFGTFDGSFRGTSQDAISGRIVGSVLNNSVESPLSGSYQAGRAP